MFRRLCLAMVLLPIHFSFSLTAQEPRTIRHDEHLRHIAFLPNDKQLLGAGSKSACVWDLETGREMRRFKVPSSIICAATSPDGKTVAIAENGPRIFLFDIASGNEVRIFAGDKLSRAADVKWSSDGQLLGACFGRTTIVWEAATGKERQRLTAGGDFLLVLAIAPGGKVLASGGLKTIQTWDLTTEKVTATLKGGFGGGAGVAALMFAPDGKTLFGQCDEPIAKGVIGSTLRQWDATTGEKVRDLAPGSFYRVVFNNDGTELASASIKDIRLWNPADGKEIRSWRVDVKQVTSLAYNRDNKMLACGSQDGQVRFFDSGTGKSITPGGAGKDSEKKSPGKDIPE